MARILLGIFILMFFSFLYWQRTLPAKQPVSEAARIERELLGKPESEQKYIDLANHYRSRSLFDRSEESSKKALELNPKNIDAYLQLGNLYRHEKRFEEAQRVIEKVLELDESNDWAYVQLGNIFRDQNELDRATEMFQKAISLNPQRSWAYKELGRVFIIRGDTKKAEEFFLAAIRVDPNPTEPDNAYLDLAGLYEQQGKIPEAEAMRTKSPKQPEPPTP